MRLLIAVLAAVVLAPLAAAQTPQLTGRIDVDPRVGLLSGDLCVRGTSGASTFLLNRGLNIRGVRNAATSQALSFDGFYNAQNRGDATPYAVEGDAHEGFCVSYVGAFPVYRVDDGERAANDWKGQIAFDGRTVRAAEQTRFYPVPIDAETGDELDQLAYDIEINCARCRSIYWSGAAPVRGSRARFASDTPRMLLLYAGDFPFTSVEGAHFVGASVSPAAANTIRTGLRAIEAAHEAYLGAEMIDEPSMLSFAALGGENRALGNNTWGFATWPTIASDGRMSFDAMAEGGPPGRLAPGRERYLAHEMAHHFFGARYTPRGPLRWFLLESTAEFLASRAVRTMQGEEAYMALLRDYARQSPAEVVPLNQPASLGGARERDQRRCRASDFGRTRAIAATRGCYLCFVPRARAASRRERG
ncbi:hypothetical protein U91I_02130 [alpha proteobacterium U9-1i]|nr:hypothetical protein U91I_02130 [alpha proteobacterium U9-1i]